MAFRLAATDAAVVCPSSLLSVLLQCTSRLLGADYYMPYSGTALFSDPSAECSSVTKRTGLIAGVRQARLRRGRALRPTRLGCHPGEPKKPLRFSGPSSPCPFSRDIERVISLLHANSLIWISGNDGAQIVCKYIITCVALYSF